MKRMNPIGENILQLKDQIPASVKLIAVSKTKPAADILQAYEADQRSFGENYVQELTEKQATLPNDIEWHFIGHLQSNKVKYIAPFVSWIHAVESEKLLIEINKQALKSGRVIKCLLQVHIAQEESKFGFDRSDILAFAKRFDGSKFSNVQICGVMGMASFSDNLDLVRSEFRMLREIFEELRTTFFSTNADFKEISMGMSGDWKMAIEEGSTMVRIGSAIFGTRNLAAI
jgi:pyridoxal phosphate enzyme (YggS family)